jgi:transcription initiation factor IIE alpha subunit
VSELERIMNQRMLVLSQMTQGKLYTTEELSRLSSLPVNRTRRALRALTKDGAILKVYRHEQIPGVQRHGDERDEIPQWMRL